MFTKILINHYTLSNETIVCEIGPGYGSFINKLYKINEFKSILIDLPEANFINAYFLKELYPQKKFFSCDIKNNKIPLNIFDAMIF